MPDVLSGIATNPDGFVVLRARRDADVKAWWAAARRRRDAPPAVSALLIGRTRVEVAQWEADDAIEWAGGVEGWSDAPRKPLFVHSR
jgi:hypothetical protein